MHTVGRGNTEQTVSTWPERAKICVLLRMSQTWKFSTTKA